MGDMNSVQFWSDHRNHKEPKPINRDPKIINLPEYVVRQLIEHNNTYTNMHMHIEDVIHTLKQIHKLKCSYHFDGDNGYIILLSRH